METEKVCVNLSAGELGKLDLLVAKGVYVNRTDVIRAALRREFAEHDWERAIDEDLVSGPRTNLAALGIGFFELSAWLLEEAVEKNEQVNAFCAGIVVIGDDVTPDLADRAIGKLRVLGSLRGPKPVLDLLAARTSGVKRR